MLHSEVRNVGSKVGSSSEWLERHARRGRKARWFNHSTTVQPC
jgi:hypothetical protein